MVGMTDLGVFSMRFRDLSRDESALEDQRAAGTLAPDGEARLRAITELLDGIESGLADRRERRGHGSDDPSIVDKYFSHTLKRWPRSGMVPFPGFFRRGDPYG